MDEDEIDVLKVALEILGYMRKYPNAADTEEHIRNWWLRFRETGQGSREISNALAMLEKNGFIEHLELPDHRVVYRLKPQIDTTNQDEGHS